MARSSRRTDQIRAVIILDTNVLSALMRANLEPAVTAWLNLQPPSAVWTTTVSLFEIQFGLNTMPTGKNQRVLKQAFADVVQQDLNNRIFAFDAAAAQEAAEIASKLQAIGRRGEIRDLTKGDENESTEPGNFTLSSLVSPFHS